MIIVLNIRLKNIKKGLCFLLLFAFLRSYIKMFEYHALEIFCPQKISNPSGKSTHRPEKKKRSQNLVLRYMPRSKF